MPHIDIRRTHALPPAEARAVVERVAAHLRDKFAMQAQWEGDTLRFSRASAKGSIALIPGEVRVQASLGLMLAPIKGLVEQEIQRKLDEQFGHAA